MAKEAIDAILQTEEEAKKRIQEAHAKAQEILDKGRAAMRKEAAQSVREARTEAEKLLQSTEERAREAQREPLEVASQKAYFLRAQEMKQRESVVSRVVDEVLHYGDR